MSGAVEYEYPPMPYDHEESILERCCMQRMQSETVLDYILRDPVSL